MGKMSAGAKAAGGKVVDGAKFVASGGKKAGDAIGDGAKKAGEAIGETATKAGEEIAKGAEAVGEFTKASLEGIGDVFDKMGVAQGFQTVMVGLGAEVDKSDEGLAKRFKGCDADSSGKISADEMRKAIEAMYLEPLPAELFAKMMAAADKDGDGEIDEDEFKQIMRAGPEKPPSKTEPAGCCSVRKPPPQ